MSELVELWAALSALWPPSPEGLGGREPCARGDATLAREVTPARRSSRPPPSAG